MPSMGKHGVSLRNGKKISSLIVQIWDCKCSLSQVTFLVILTGRRRKKHRSPLGLKPGTFAMGVRQLLGGSTGPG